MATVRIPAEQRTLSDQDEVTQYLAKLGIEYERWPSAERVAPDASAEAVLAAYSAEIETLKTRGAYVTADVIDVTAQTPGLEAMLAKFKTEHWHDEDEVRFIIRGRGLFHIHPRNDGGEGGGEGGGAPVIAIEVEAGDLIRVPRGTWHWFDLCADRDIRAIRLFQDKSGWTPHYTHSGADQGYQPLCMGPTYIPLRTASS
jgi:1,2-dihydroxy-3-keto-5-methylthiopentene dioxygenase